MDDASHLSLSPPPPLSLSLPPYLLPSLPLSLSLLPPLSLPANIESLFSGGFGSGFFLSFFLFSRKFQQRIFQNPDLRPSSGAHEALLTEVCMSMARWSRICRTIVRGYTGWLASIRYMAVSMVISTPVRPMPALKTQVHFITGFVIQSRRFIFNAQSCMQVIYDIRAKLLFFLQDKIQD